MRYFVSVFLSAGIPGTGKPVSVGSAADDTMNDGINTPYIEYIKGSVKEHYKHLSS